VIAEAHSTVTDLRPGDRVSYGGEGSGHGETILAGRNLVARIPDTVDFEHACFATLGSIAMNAVRIAGIGLGDVVAVIGQGLVGQLISQLAKLQGGVVVPIDLKPERVELAQSLGAERGRCKDSQMAVVRIASSSQPPPSPMGRAARRCNFAATVGASSWSAPWR